MEAGKQEEGVRWEDTRRVNGGGNIICHLLYAICACGQSMDQLVVGEAIQAFQLICNAIRSFKTEHRSHTISILKHACGDI